MIHLIYFDLFETKFLKIQIFQFIVCSQVYSSISIGNHKAAIRLVTSGKLLSSLNDTKRTYMKDTQMYDLYNLLTITLKHLLIIILDPFGKTD